MVKQITPALIDDLVDAFVPDSRLAFFTHTSGAPLRVSARRIPHSCTAMQKP